MRALSITAAFLLSLPIRLYRLCVAPLLPRRVCRFYPSCSEYALTALKTHGPLKGLWLAVWRVLRCNPFHPGGVDLVPARPDVGPCGHPHSGKAA